MIQTIPIWLVVLLFLILYSIDTVYYRICFAIVISLSLGLHGSVSRKCLHCTLFKVILLPLNLYYYPILNTLSISYWFLHSYTLLLLTYIPYTSIHPSKSPSNRFYYVNSLIIPTYAYPCLYALILAYTDIWLLFSTI